MSITEVVLDALQEDEKLCAREIEELTGASPTLIRTVASREGYIMPSLGDRVMALRESREMVLDENVRLRGEVRRLKREMGEA